MTSPLVWHVAQLIVASVWLGLLLGVSFLATPVKFRASSLSLPVALEVGQATFALFHPVEWLMLVLLVLFLLLQGAAGVAWVPAAGLIILLAVTAAWLLPALDRRTREVMTGAPAGSSSLHWFYIGADGIKLCLLVWLIWLRVAAILTAT